MMKRRGRADPKAGGNHSHGPRHGKHTRNPGWIPGEHWFCCQRCGLDHYAKDGRREWTGAIVCASCWEPRHPQDFVRSHPERITPPDGLFTCGLNLGEGGPAAAGSTEVPFGTFVTSEWLGIRVPVADQSHETGETITTLVTSGCFHSGYVDQVSGDTIIVASYAANVLPLGLSINTTTGDITGTIADSAAVTTHSVVVTATYTSGVRATCPFFWTVLDGGRAPDHGDITGSKLALWWDFSEDEYCFSDLTAATPCVDEADLATVLSRVDVEDETLEGHPDAGFTSTGVWDANVKNGLGAFDASLLPADAVPVLESDSALSACKFQPFEIFVVAQIPEIADVENTGNGLFAPTSAKGHRFNITDTDEGADGNMNSCWNDEIFPNHNVTTEVGPSWTSHQNEWHVFYFKFFNTDCAYLVNGGVPVGSDTQVDEHDANTDAPFDPQMVSFRIGATSLCQGTPAAPVSGWKSYIGETIVFANSTSHGNEGALASAEVAFINQYLVNKWAITDEVISIGD